jgi:hypothetical protein
MPAVLFCPNAKAGEGFRGDARIIVKLLPHMIPRPLAMAITLAAVAAVPALWAADTDAASQPTTPVTETAARPANATPHLFSFDFRGGTIAELLTGKSIISDASVFVLNKDGISINGAKVSNVASGDTATVIPPFSIRNATPENIVRAFNEAMASFGLSLATNGSSFLLITGKAPNQSSETASAQATAAKPTIPPINIDFPGGSVAQLVALINHSDSATFNLIGEKTYQEAPLPPFSLRNVDPSSLAVALNGLLHWSDLTIKLAGTNIFVLTKISSQPSLFAPAAPTFQAFQLAPYLTTLSVENITDAILVAWESAPGGDPKQLRFKYHPPTKLLFVYGPPEAIALASQLVPQLDPNATTRARLDSYRSSAKSSGDGLKQIDNSTPPILHESTAEEARRLEAVTQEVLRRRELRQNVGDSLPPLENK